MSQSFTQPSAASIPAHVAAPGRCPACGALWGNRPFCPNDGTLGLSGGVFGERYVLECLIGAGGMGFVFAGRHHLLGRRVAIKVLRADLGSDAEQVGRFLREAQLCSQIQHENIIDILDFGRDAGSGDLYLVMELLEGRSLADLLAGEGSCQAEPSVFVPAPTPAPEPTEPSPRRQALLQPVPVPTPAVATSSDATWPTEHPPRRARRPFYKHWAFWTAVGVVVAGAATGVALAVQGGSGGKPGADLNIDARALTGLRW